VTVTVACALVKCAVAIGIHVAVVALAVAGCGSGDSTASKTPGPTAASTPSGTTAPSAPPTATGPLPGPPAANDPCATDLAAPEIAKAVSELPRDPRSNQGWNPEPLAGNYNECAQLSAVVIKANTNSENPNTRALLFHRGKFIPTGVPDTYGFNGLDTSVSTGDTVALQYIGGVPGLDSVVKFRWNGSGVELIGNTPG
jgi:LppP/LprE lipoprotein